MKRFCIILTLNRSIIFLRKYLFLFAFFLTIISWFGTLYYYDLSLTIKNIIIIHKNNFYLVLIDILFFFVFIYEKMVLSVIKINQLIESKLKQKEIVIKIYSEWIDNIINGSDTSKFRKLVGEVEIAEKLYLLENKIYTEVEKENKRRWISEGKNLINDIIRSSNSIEDLAYNVIRELALYTEMVIGVFFNFNEISKELESIATYAFHRRKYIKQKFQIGEGLVGEAAFEREIIYRTEIPNNYNKIKSGLLNDAVPSSIFIIPLIYNDEVQGVIEFASLKKEIDNCILEFFESCSTLISQALFAFKANIKTSLLLQETQKYAKELMAKQDMLNRHAEEMQKAQKELELTNEILEKKIKEVKNSEYKIQSILENISEFITIYDKEGVLRYESPSMKHVFGSAENEVKISGLLYNIGPTGNPVLYEIFQYLLKNPYREKSVEYKYIRKNGDVLWFQTTGRNLLHNDAIQGIVFSTRDITIHKMAEKEQRMKTQMQALSENSPDMIVRLSIDGQFFYTNPVFEQITGYKYKDVVKKYIEKIILDQSIGSFFAEVLFKITNYPVRYDTEKEFNTKMGKRIMYVSVIPETNEDKVVETILVVAHDITEQKMIENEIKEKNKKIQESINYARHIQESILPTSQFLKNYFPESFLLYIPRDVVSGDFPWFYVTENAIYFAAVDCTGHGVPGAMISFIGHFTLNNIINTYNNLTAGEILDRLHFQVRKTLRQEDENATTRDGMDIALCKYIPERNELHFSGAHRPLYLFRNGELYQYDADLKAIGGIPPRKKMEKLFTNYVIQLKEKDRIFIFSDGLPDQEGGPEGLKYSTRRIRDGIIRNSHLEMEELKEYFFNDFLIWKNNNKQIDDVLMIGIEI